MLPTTCKNKIALTAQYSEHIYMSKGRIRSPNGIQILKVYGSRIRIQNTALEDRTKSCRWFRNIQSGEEWAGIVRKGGGGGFQRGQVQYGRGPHRQVRVLSGSHKDIRGWLKGTQDGEFFWLRFWNLRYFFDSYVKILRFYKNIFWLGHFWEDYAEWKKILS